MKILYSWQADLDWQTNRYFVKKVLESLAGRLDVEGPVKVVPIADRDARGMSDSPDMLNAILAAINSADIFVGDVSIINGKTVAAGKGELRPMPNPHVLFELGYTAAQGRGWEKIVLVINTAFGEDSLLPFAFDQRRIATYNLPVNFDAQMEEDARRTLEHNLLRAMRLKTVEPRISSPFVIPASNESPRNESFANQSFSNVPPAVKSFGDESSGFEPFSRPPGITPFKIESSNNTSSSQTLWNGEPESIRKLISQKPDFWEYLLTIELLKHGLEAPRREYRRVRESLVPDSVKVLRNVQFVDYIQEKLEELRSMLRELDYSLSQGIPVSWGAPGAPGDVGQIKEATGRLIELYKQFADWEKDIRSVKVVHENPKRIVALFKGLTGYLASAVEELLSKMIEVFEQPNPKGEYELDIKVSFPEGRVEEIENEALKFKDWIEQNPEEYAYGS